MYMSIPSAQSRLLVSITMHGNDAWKPFWNSSLCVLWFEMQPQKSAHRSKNLGFLTALVCSRKGTDKDNCFLHDVRPAKLHAFKGEKVSEMQ